LKRPNTDEGTDRLGIMAVIINFMLSFSLLLNWYPEEPKRMDLDRFPLRSSVHMCEFFFFFFNIFVGDFFFLFVFVMFVRTCVNSCTFVTRYFLVTS
jgi:hypothetical protein